MDYPTGRLALDLTADRSTLQDGQASVVVGRDVLNRNRLARGPGRKPVLTNRDDPDDPEAFAPRGPLTTAIRSDFHGNATQVTTGSSGAVLNSTAIEAVWTNCIYRAPRVENLNRGEFAITAAAEDWGQLSEAMVRGFFQVVSPYPFIRPKTILDFRPVATSFSVPAIYFFEEQWGLSGSRDFFLDDLGQVDPEVRPFEFVITYREFYDKRGIWVSDGQSFWLLHNGQYTKYLNLGDDSGTLGTEWRGSQISPTVFMFVAENQLPRVIQLGALPAAESTAHGIIPGSEPPVRGGVTEVGETEYLAGLVPPDTEVLQERNALDFEKEQFAELTVSESMSSSVTGVTKANETGPASYRLKARVVDDATGAASAFVDCYDRGNSLVTHRFTARLFVTFNQAASEDILLVPPSNLGAPETELPIKTARATHIEFWRTTSLGIDYFLELRKSLVWPITTFETGRSVPNYSTMVSRDPVVWGVLGMSDDELIFGDVLDRRLRQTGGLPPACRDVISIQAMTICGGAGTQPVSYVQEGKHVIWPRLSSDEEIVHSEIGVEGATLVESFYYGAGDSSRDPDLRRLSRAGDTFQAFTVAGDVALAVMRHGAHVIRRVGDSVETQALAERGAGTPWAKTVLSIGDVAMWATTNGLRIYNPTANDGAGVLSLIQYEEMSDWFAEALREGMDVEAGFDERRGTLHFRRSLGGEFVDGSVYNLKFKAWSLMEDDNGFRYVSSTHADATAKEAAALYSIGTDGSVFEVNYEGTTHPYDGHAVQGTIGSEFRATTALGSPLPNQIHSNVQERLTFDRIMAGDIVRFRSSTQPVLDGLTRKIVWSDAARIAFDRLPAPFEDGDEFIIGAVPFRARWHPVTGAFSGNVKTLEALEVVARPGPRHSENPLWPDRPEAKLTVRAYRDIGNDPVEEQLADISIFADEDAEFVSDDRFSKAEIQGTTIEIEVESLDARADFVLTRVVGRYREDGDQQSDASTTD